MKLSKRDTNLLLVLVGLMVFLGAYLGISNRFDEKTEGLESEITALMPRLEELRGHEARLSEYQAGIDESIASVEAELSRYPSDVRPEDLLMYAIELRENVGLSIDSVSFASVESVSSFEIVRQDENGAAVFVPMAAMKTGFSTSCELTYEQMKKLVQYLYATEQCTTLERLSVSYNAESGNLFGSVDIGKYFVCGENYKYTPTEVPQVRLQTDNPFKTFAVTSEPERTDSENTEN